ncbi:hypothetical protein Q4E93_06120 [Flavitalea sp. BT771]|uniref:hypothetical protein n=1 Tax=Flavitalea sp. BT771 TaxID=3063329 RepID=UPI0026E1D9E7|nr:hypothetical protein [Flavitalea sp. BT771]MDO6430151.1 hypothetical protein [Flavitalea sp. BT771]MDV6219710.1 hypothetical protein [Flavitalea sp. BT771]
MSNNRVFFGYISFLREKVDAAIEIMSKRRSDYLWQCFNPSRMVQDGPTEENPNMSFSIILDTDDPDDIVADIEAVVRQLPFSSCTLVVENLSTREHFVHNWERIEPSHTL